MTKVQFANAVKARDGRQCMICGWRPKDGEECWLECHHVKPAKDYPELAYAMSNAITVCWKCHFLVSEYGARHMCKRREPPDEVRLRMNPRRFPAWEAKRRIENYLRGLED